MSKINQLVQQTNADANSDLSDLLDQKVDRRALYKEIVSNKALDSLPVATKKLLRNGTQKTLKAMIHNATLLQNMKSLTWSEAKQNLAQNQDAQS